MLVSYTLCLHVFFFFFNFINFIVDSDSMLYFVTTPICNDCLFGRLINIAGFFLGCLKKC